MLSFKNKFDKFNFVRLIALLLLTMALPSAPDCHAADNAMPDLGPVGEIKKLHTDFKFTEGPASDGHGNVYFTDIPANRIYTADQHGKLSVFLEPSQHANGLMFGPNGQLFACLMDGSLAEINIKTRKVAQLAPKYMGNRFNAPNDLVIDKSGGIYFTDPRFRAPEPLPQGTEGVYYRAADGKVTRVANFDIAPNGVILSPDEKTLYVIPSLSKTMLAFSVEQPGHLQESKTFCVVKQPDGAKRESGGDGLTVDVMGNLYITTALGLQVFSPAGKLLGIIEFPEQPANVTFAGPENKTLYVTARKSLYTAKMKVAGHVFPGR